MGTIVVSCRLEEEEHRKFIKAAKVTRGSDAIASDVLKELIAQFISKALVGPSYPQEHAEGSIEKRSGSPEIHVNKASQVEEETPLENRVNSETAPIESVKVRAQQCPFYNFINKTQLVECSKDRLKGRRNWLITQQTCDLCWDHIRCPGRRPEYPTEASSGDAEKDDAE